MPSAGTPPIIIKERVTRIFQFLRAFSDQNHPAPRRIEEQPWRVELANLPPHPSIQDARGSGRRRAASADARQAAERSASSSRLEPGALEEDVILAVSRPRLTEPPPPPSPLRGFVPDTFDDPFSSLERSSSTEGRARGRSAPNLDADPALLRAHREWVKAWEAWAARERPSRVALRLFEDLYAIHALLEREGERHELIVGDGVLSWRRKDGDVEHPILLQRLQLEFNPDVPEFRLRESAHPPEIYSSLFSSLPNLDGRALARIRDRFAAAPCHPLGGPETEEFLNFCAVQLSPRGRLLESRPAEPSEDPVILRSPTLFQRTRTLGYGTAVEAILEDIEAADEARIAPALARVVGVEPPLPALEGEGEAPPGGTEILLSKPANPEQIRIAERLEKYGSVLVQGPPGTGKTHTIANLIGHLLAQGKTVLVTADTTKALRVVRDQVEEKLRPLCVSVLDNDLEGRKQLEEAVEVIADEISHADLDDLVRQEAERARARRERFLALEAIEAELREARADEYRPVVVGSLALSPADAARRVAEARARAGWIPGPLLGDELPLTPSELAAIHRTQATTTPEDEAELGGGGLPVLDALPSPAEVDLWTNLFERRKTVAESADLWPETADAHHLELLGTLDESIQRAQRAAATDAPWQVAVLDAGYRGGPYREPWDRLLELIETTSLLAATAKEHLIRHDPHVERLGEEEALLAINAELEAHVRRGGELGRVDLLLRPRWKAYLDQATVGGRRPESAEHFEALAHLLRLRASRSELAMRWNRLVEAASGPSARELGSALEVTARQLAGVLRSLLDWHDRHHVPVKAKLAEAQFAWERFLDRRPPETGTYGEIERIGPALHHALRSEIQARLIRLEAERAAEHLAFIRAELDALAARPDGAPGIACALSSALAARDAAAYRAAYERLETLHRLREAIVERRALLARLEVAAPTWAAALRDRSGVHGGPELPGDPAEAWTLRRLEEELDRRASRSMASLQAARERAAAELHRDTLALIEARAWLAQRKRMTLSQQQSLTGWLDTQRALGKGTGKKAPEMKAEARRLMTACQTAVPVWIMPLSRVVESFDPREVRFDVVIVDEASQCDLFALVALYLGRQVVVVGDHEQVSPSAVGDNLEASSQLIAQHLRGIPNAHLYDGRLSVYDLARQSFGGLLALREHFRSVPAIIEFSNQLSYLGRILPLRDSSTAALLPATIAYRVTEARSVDKVNRAEAEAITALIVAATEQREYDGATFGVVSLVGEEQAFEIEGLLRRHLSPREYERRRIVCGNASHLQGDERDVMFLSLVDVADRGPLALREHQSFKQRFNVAASRAKDQMWVVHSMDPHADLKPDDLRRRLIIHAQGAGRDEARSAGASSEGSTFERLVAERLLQAGFDVHVGRPIGNCRIDLVVRGVSGGRVAISCEGDRARDLETLAKESDRQAVLERLGWTFIRVRATEFFRNPEATTAALVDALASRGIDRGAPRVVSLPVDDLKDRVISRAEALRASGFAGLASPAKGSALESGEGLPPRKLRAVRAGG